MRERAHGAWLPIAATVATLSGIAGAIAFALAHFAFGGALMTISILLLRWPRSIWAVDEKSISEPRWKWLLFVAVCAVAVFFRFYRMSPPGLWGDDALNGLLAFSVLDGQIRSPFEIIIHSHSRFHALSNYAIAASFELFGAGPATLRLPGIVANTLCVPLLYATFAPLFGARVALLAAFFFSTSAWQLSHAKGLTQVVLGASFQIAGLCLLVRGMTGRRRWMVVTAAVPLALCVYTYHSAKIAPLVALPYFVAATLETPRPRRRTWLVGALSLAALALCLVPAYLSYANNPGALIARIAGTSQLPTIGEQGWRPLWKSIWRTLLNFHYQQGPLQYHWFGLGFDPTLNWVVGFLALHGLVQTLRHPLRSRNVLLLSWFVIGLAPAVLSTEAPRAYRAFHAAPPVYVFAALPLARLLELHPTSQRIRGYLRTLAILLVLAVPIIVYYS
jgi:4-amino-4-deoxy-L-arabinose transferase-like glycosyltransferase